MLVYVNVLRYDGVEHFEAAAGCVSLWLSRKARRVIATAEIVRDFDIALPRGASIRCSAQTATSPEVYSISYSHQDVEVPGRRWETEIGFVVEREQSVFEVSIQVSVSDVSAAVKSPVSASCPGVVRLLRDVPGLSGSVVGRNIDEVDDSLTSLANLRDYVWSEGRHRPMVIVSAKSDGTYPVAAERLQELLFGLAQVYRISQEVSSWDIESVLSKLYGPWGGAIIIVAPRRRFSSSPYRKLYRVDAIEDVLVGENGINSFLSDVLATVTFATNSELRRLHVGPQQVRVQTQSQRIATLRARVAEAKSEDGLLEEALTEITKISAELSSARSAREEEFWEYESRVSELEEIRSELEKRIATVESERGALVYQLAKKGDALAAVSPEFVKDCARVMAFDELTPEFSLRMIAEAYSDRVRILDTALKSARDSERFSSSSRLLAMLIKLCTDYVDRLRAGVESRTVFSNDEYAATESETTLANSSMKRMRTFDVDGKSVLMDRHLKIGKVDNVQLAIRVYFQWDAAASKVIVGYCGPHLPVSSH